MCWLRPHVPHLAAEQTCCLFGRCFSQDLETLSSWLLHNELVSPSTGKRTKQCEPFAAAATATVTLGLHTLTGMFHGRSHDEEGHGDADGDEDLDQLSHPRVRPVTLLNDLGRRWRLRKTIGDVKVKGIR